MASFWNELISFSERVPVLVQHMHEIRANIIERRPIVVDPLVASQWVESPQAGAYKFIEFVRNNQFNNRFITAAREAIRQAGAGFLLYGAPSRKTARSAWGLVLNNAREDNVFPEVVTLHVPYHQITPELMSLYLATNPTMKRRYDGTLERLNLDP